MILHPERNLAVLIEVTRGPIVESAHFGSIAVADVEGKLIASAGNAGAITYYRSASKPLQALPVVESGAADRFGFTEREIALICGSHDGEDIHVEAVAEMLSKMGLGPDALACGVHMPYGKAAARALQDAGESPTTLHNNCSGKHAGMLALAMHHDWPIGGYENPRHPVQKAMLALMADFTGVPQDEIAIGIDGCSVGTFGVSVHAMATSFARLAQPDYWAEPRRSAVQRIRDAMIAHPEMVGARESRLDTDLMRAACGTVIAKVGAEGVYCAARLPQNDNGALGFALKILDGDRFDRARDPALLEGLRQSGIVTEDTLSHLELYWKAEVRNRPGDVVGMVRPAFTLMAHG